MLRNCTDHKMGDNKDDSVHLGDEVDNWGYEDFAEMEWD